MKDKKYSELIKEIIRFKAAVDKIATTRLPHKLLGELGEFYVIKKLQSLGFKNIVHKGGHSQYDILLKEQGIKIEVRTSLLKNEGVYPKGIDFFGWRVKTKNQKDTKRFDILIGVALPDSFKRPKFYVFTNKETEKIDTVKGGRFSSITKKIHLFKNLEILKKAISAAITKAPRRKRKNRLYKHRWSAKA